LAISEGLFFADVLGLSRFFFGAIPILTAGPRYSLYPLEKRGCHYYRLSLTRSACRALALAARREYNGQFSLGRFLTYH